MTTEATLPETPVHLPLQADVAIIGAGPAGLMAAQVLSEAGVSVHVFDAMPSVGRKFLLAGKGGLNLTHSEDSAQFLTRYGARSGAMESLLTPFDANAVRAWAQDLGIATFVGSSGRVFPQDMRAAPLLRAWLQRLRHPAAAGAQPVQFFMRHRWTGWAAGTDSTAEVLEFETPQGLQPVTARATILALGGGSWARLGSNGAWVPLLAQRGVDVAPLQPANCGFDVQGGWSSLFSEKFAGQPFKSVALSATDSKGNTFSRKGEFVATATGVEGSLVYAASALLRDEIARSGSATFLLDLLPDFTAERVLAEVRHPRGSRSLTSHLKSRLHLDGIKMAMLYECLPREAMQQPETLAAAIKAVPITLQAARPLDEAISSAGGVRFEAANAALMLTPLPGVFCAGEMLDWEAPTGGYLLQGCLASGRCAALGVKAYLDAK
jgi:uncharacterized flavoprotein (TIGR03862 family)